MWRMRRVRLVVLMFAVIGAGGGYWLTHRDSGEVLRTVTLAAVEPRFIWLEEGQGRFYVANNDTAHPVSILDTRTGTPVQLSGALSQISGIPSVDYQSGHTFSAGKQNGKYLMIDTRTGVLLKTIPIPWQGGFYADTLDVRRDRDLVAFADTPVMVVIDARSGRVLRTVASCLAYSAPVISYSTRRVFEFCDDGRELVFDGASYRLVASVAVRAIGTGSLRTILVDETTRRVFEPGAYGYGVYDASTGALVRRLPLLGWWVGTQDLVPGPHEVVVAPFEFPGSQPPRSVAVLDGRSGAILHRWPVPANPLAVLVNPLTGHVLVASAGPWDTNGEPDGYGILSVLDARTGRILQQIETGVLPGAMAADRLTRHLFVVNFNSNNNGQLVTHSYPDGEWPATLRRIKSALGWLPFTAPDLPPPPSNATVMMLDLSKL